MFDLKERLVVGSERVSQLVKRRRDGCNYYDTGMEQIVEERKKEKQIAVRREK